MKPSVLVLSNNHFKGTSYAAGLSGFGCDVYDIHTVEAARALLRTQPHLDCIIIDMKFSVEETRNFMWAVRGEMGYRQTRMILIGSSDRDAGEAAAAWATFLPRPADMSEILSAMHRSYES
jgi:hypothetical protein